MYVMAINAYIRNLQMNKNNRTFPILSVGYEFLLNIANNHDPLLLYCNVEENLSLNFTRAASNSALFRNASQQLLSMLSSSKLTRNQHR